MQGSVRDVHDDTMRCKAAAHRSNGDTTQPVGVSEEQAVNKSMLHKPGIQTDPLSVRGKSEEKGCCHIKDEDPKDQSDTGSSQVCSMLGDHSTSACPCQVRLHNYLT